MIRTTPTTTIDPAARPVPRLVVDLAQIQSNYRRLRDLAAPAATGAVVKANAYGLGAEEIVPALAEAGCRSFYVANTSEGVDARRALGSHEADIFVFNGFWPGECDALRQARLFPVLNDLAQLDALRTQAPDLPCALHFDTGMNRLGFGPEDTETLLADLSRLDGLDVRQILSHLACADTPDHALNSAQCDRFARLADVFPDIPACFANSAGILLGDRYHFDAVRPGIAIYGGAPTPGMADPFKPAVRIDAPILQIRELSPGETIGYGATFTATRPMRIAILAAGYGDGLLWASAKGGVGYVADTCLPIVGRVSMDLIAVDLGPLHTPVRPGMPVSFLGRELEQIAGAAGTISYECLVRLGPRFERVYER